MDGHVDAIHGIFQFRGGCGLCVEMDLIGQFGMPEMEAHVGQYDQNQIDPPGNPAGEGE